MTRFTRWAGATALVALTLPIAGCSEPTTSPEIAAAKTSPLGNGAPSGYHYNLQIHGVVDRGQTLPSANGHNMWVKLWGNTKINLTEGPYTVLDSNGLDGETTFQLPNPDADGDGVTTYSVFARGLGKGHAKVALCATDPSDGSLVCNTGSLEVTLGKGNNRFSNVSKELLFLWDVDLDGDGVVDLSRVGLFDPALQGYFWDYDNYGLRLAQLRFYPCSTDVGSTSSDPINDAACFS